MASSSLPQKPFIPKSGVMDPAYCLCLPPSLCDKMLHSAVGANCRFLMYSPISFTLRIKLQNSLFFILYNEKKILTPCKAQSTFNCQTATICQLSEASELQTTLQTCVLLANSTLSPFHHSKRQNQVFTPFPLRNPVFLPNLS